DLHVLEVLSDTNWLRGCNLSEQVVERLQIALAQVGGHGRLKAAAGGCVVALLGGLDERVEAWGNRHRLQGSKEVAEAIRELLSKGGNLLVEEWQRAVWARDLNTIAAFQRPLGGARALVRVLLDAAAGRVKEN